MAGIGLGIPVPGVGYGSPLSVHPLVRLSDGGAAPGQTTVATEVPVAFVYNGRSHVVMMSTPADLEDLAVGFSISEEIVHGAAEIAHLDVVRYSRGIELQMSIPAEAAERLAERGRAIAGRTGCGLCGAEAIDDVLREVPAVESALVIARDALFRAGAALDEHQPYNHDTRTVHAAAWVTPDGALRVVREDVGRHNALDKVLGALAREGIDAREGFLVVTSRASYEMVQKSATVGIALLAAISAPTALAIHLADETGMTLIGFARSESHVVYTHPARVMRIAEGVHA